MLRIILLNLLMIAFCCKSLIAQPSEAENTFNKIAAPQSSPQWLKIKPIEQVHKTTFLSQAKDIFQLNEHHQLSTSKTQTDPVGFTHHRLQQTYKGIPVKDGQYILHEKAGVIHSANGHLVSNIDVETTPTLSKTEALEILLQDINAEEYAWENEDMENLIKHQLEDETATYEPDGKLLIMSPQSSNDPYLAYEFDVYATQPHHYHTYYVDAHTGEILETIGLFCHIQAQTNYGIQNVATSLNTNGCEMLLDPVRNIETLTNNGAAGLNYIRLNDCDDDGNGIWEASNFGATAHWIVQETYDYFLNVHGYNGYNGLGGKLITFIEYDNQNDNQNEAFGGGGLIKLENGDGIEIGNMVSIDIVVHEYMHSLIQKTTNLTTFKESGALHESFADIFGTIIEYRLDSMYNLTDTPFDWLLGEDVYLNGNNAFRSMSDPKQLGDPDTYQGENWFTGLDQGTFTHTNNGVQNYWFYLLANGGSGVNDNGQSYNVSGIGLHKATQITWSNLVNYLTSNATYQEARNGSIQAAEALYGVGSIEAQQVRDAWCAVGVGECNNTSTGSLTLLTPNGGDTLNEGTNYNIVWSQTGNTGNTVMLECSIDGGTNWILIDDDVPNAGTYTWTVPAYDSPISLIRITANNNVDIFDESDNYFILENCEVQANFSANNNAPCAGESVTFSVADSIGAVSGIAWYINDVYQGGQVDLIYNFSQPGTYNIELRAFSIGGICASFYEEQITVYPLADASFTHTVSGSTITLIANQDDENTSYLWDNGADTREITYNALTSGTYTFCLSVTRCGTDVQCQDVEVMTDFCTNAPNVEWEKPYIFAASEYVDIFYEIKQKADGNFVVGGSHFDMTTTPQTQPFNNAFFEVDEFGNFPMEGFSSSFGFGAEDYGYTFDLTNDGSIVIAGDVLTDSWDIVIAKIDSSYFAHPFIDVNNPAPVFPIEFFHFYGGSAYESVSIIQQTNDGGFIVGGSSQSNDGNVGGNNGSSDFWIFKTDAAGNIQWEQNYGGSNFDWLATLEQTSDDGFILGGYSNSTDGDVGGNNGGNDFWIVKIDALGNIQWEQNYGGSDNEGISSIQQTSDGGYILGGSSRSSNGDVGGNNGNSDYWVVKTDALGNIQWEQNYGGSAYDNLVAVQETSNGEYILGGYSFSSDVDVSNNYGGQDYWLVQIDALGNLLWEQNYGKEDYDYLSSMQLTQDGGIILGGVQEMTPEYVPFYFDNLSNLLTTIVVSSSFQTNPDNSIVVQSADDFTVTSPNSTIHTVEVVGSWEQGTGVATAYHVEIYADNLGKPGLLVYSDVSIPIDPDNSSPSITLSTPCILDEGTYWLSVYVETDPANLWYWNSAYSNSGIEALVIDTADHFQVGLTEWTSINSIFDNNEHNDFAFALSSFSPYPVPTFFMTKLSPPCQTNCLAADSLVLIDLYYKTDGSNWTNTWDLVQPVDTWHGITLNPDGCQVTAINLSDNNLNGKIPEQLSQLQLLSDLDLSNNKLEGNIPGALADLINLTNLNLENNELSDCYPTRLCEKLYISYNFSENSALLDNGSDEGFQNFCYDNLHCDTYPVYPGDFNFDGVANYKDLTEYGKWYGQTGAKRIRNEQNIYWIPHESTSWGILRDSYFDIKHVDADGNGIIDLYDLQAVQDNYKLTHSDSPNGPNNTTSQNSPIDIHVRPAPIPITETQDDIIIEMDIVLENTLANDVSIYGGFFSIGYGNAGNIIPTLDLNIVESWLGKPNQNLQFLIEKDSVNQVFNIGFTRIDHSNAIGEGSIGKILACIPNDTPWDSDSLLFTVSNIYADDSEADELPIANTTALFSFSNPASCNANLSITQNTILQSQHQASNIIQTSGNVTIEDNQNITFKSDEARLNEGFYVELGADFLFLNEPCGAAPKPTQTENVQLYKVNQEVEYLKSTNELTLHYETKKKIDVSFDIILPDEQKISLFENTNQEIGSHQITVDRQLIPTGEVLACLKKGKHRHYFMIQN